MSTIPAFSRQIDIAEIGEGKVVKSIEATPQERAQLAAALGLVDIAALSAEIELARDSKGVIHADGRLNADILQTCVVSLVPVEQRIDEPISVRFIRAGAPHVEKAAREASEIEVDPMAEDPPEVVAGPTIDLGPTILEHFIMAIDPYPRAPGAVLPENPVEDALQSGDSPFAALAKLRRRRPNER